MGQNSNTTTKNYQQNAHFEFHGIVLFNQKLAIQYLGIKNGVSESNRLDELLTESERNLSRYSHMANGHILRQFKDTFALLP